MLLGCIFGHNGGYHQGQQHWGGGAGGRENSRGPDWLGGGKILVKCPIMGAIVKRVRGL